MPSTSVIRPFTSTVSVGMERVTALRAGRAAGRLPEMLGLWQTCLTVVFWMRSNARLQALAVHTRVQRAACDRLSNVEL